MTVQTPATINNRIVEKVFIALRTDFFGMGNDEHITLKYFNKVHMDHLVQVCKDLDNAVPLYVTLDGFGNWRSPNGEFYEVAMVRDDSVIFTGVKTPHITIRKSAGPLSNATFIPSLWEPQLVDTVYIGKKIKGVLTWMPYNSKEFSVSQLQNFWSGL